MTEIDESSIPVELTAEGARPKDTSWGVFGDRYMIGTLNFLTPQRIQAAARLVRTGRRFNLNLPLNRPPRSGDDGIRHSYRHTYISHTEGPGAGQLDEQLDNFNTQSSTQWDGFAHVRHPRLGFYNGVDPDAVKPGDGSKHSIGAWTETGAIVGRGVLLDVERYYKGNGRPYDPASRFVITRDIVETIAKWEHVELGAGDIILIRTGNQRAEARGQRGPEAAGLGPGREMGAFLWAKRIAAVAADTSSFDPAPIEARGPRSMHMQLIPMLGMPIGELFALDELAADCAQDGIYEFLFISVPLNLPGGVASPANALAIK